MTRRVVCPGSFDPVTLGHLDVIGRAVELFDQVVVAVGTNRAKRYLFTAEERIGMVREAGTAWPSVTVVGFSGLLTTLCADQSAIAVVKGVRNAADLDFEQQMAGMNEHLSGIQTIFLPASGAFGNVSSSLIKEVAGLGGDVRAFLPDFVADRLTERLAKGLAEPSAEPVAERPTDG
ncbi:MAG: pantetheine-phosphate adenylyltransferase [Nocardioides sp.]